MATLVKSIEEQIKAYCAKVGADPLLVQGAGGNVSWKDGDTLWVKASGTWLADAAKKDIFVPVDLPHLRGALGAGDFAVVPRVRGASTLRPSIETLLHALMPQRVVVHLHAIEALAYLVRENFRSDFESLLDASIAWAVVDYFKPGADLAAAIDGALIEKPTANVIFLKNHGVVIGGDDVAEVNHIVGALTQALKTMPADIRPVPRRISAPPAALFGRYAKVADPDVHQLALNPNLFNRLNTDWALYPDHVVFLGPRAHTYRSWKDFRSQETSLGDAPELVFIEGEGVYANKAFNKAKQVQLRCYLDVMARQRPHSAMNVLTNAHIAELLNWDAEQYRINLAKLETQPGMIERVVRQTNSIFGLAMAEQVELIEIFMSKLEMLGYAM